MNSHDEKYYEDRIASDWIATYSPDELPPDTYDPLWVIELIIMSSPSTSWFILSAVLNQDADGASLPMLVAGPLESWMGKYSEEWIDFIEGEARCNPRFKWASGGLNQNAIADDVWQRIERARGAVWSADGPPPVPPRQD